MKKIYTLGTGRRSEEDFVEILLSYNIKTLVDVRSFPKSKMPVFTRENLENLLKREGMGYVFFGKELGGFRKGGYEAYTETEDFKKGIDELGEHCRIRHKRNYLCRAISVEMPQEMDFKRASQGAAGRWSISLTKARSGRRGVE